MLAAAEWDVALLQECPPRFAAPLARACAAEGHRVLTSRNSLGALRAAAARLNPDLIASGEGGSNLTLVRAASALGGIAERREMAIHEGRPERRAMAFTRTGSGVCVANLHATNDVPRLAAEDVLVAAARRDRVGGRGAAALRRRPQPAARRRRPASSTSCASASASAGRPRPTRSTTSSSAACEALEPPRALAGRAARGRARTAWRCASPTTRRSRRGSRHRDDARHEIVRPIPTATRQAPATTRRRRSMAEKKSEIRQSDEKSQSSLARRKRPLANPPRRKQKRKPKRNRRGNRKPRRREPPPASTRASSSSAKASSRTSP